MECHCVTGMEEDKDEEKIPAQEDLKDLSNAEITARLRSLGQSCGPVRATTRKAYLNKLSKLLQSGDALENNDAASGEEAVYSPPVTRGTSRRRLMGAAHMQPVVLVRKGDLISDVERNETYCLNTSRQRNDDTTVTDDVEEEITPAPEIHNVTETGSAPETSNSSKSERRWIPMWLKIAFMMVVPCVFLISQEIENYSRPPSSFCDFINASFHL